MAQTAEQATPTQLTMLVTAITLAEAAGAATSRYLRPDAATQYGLLVASALCFAAMAAAPDVFLPAAPDGTRRPCICLPRVSGMFHMPLNGHSIGTDMTYDIVPKELDARRSMRGPTRR